MKRRVGVLVTVLVALPLIAGETEERVRSYSDKHLRLIERNLVVALESGVACMAADAALVLRDLKRIRPEQSFTSAVIPLMRILKNDECRCGCRVAAALALHQLQSERGDFAIEREAQFSSSRYVRHICRWLAYERTNEKTLRPGKPLEEEKNLAAHQRIP